MDYTVEYLPDGWVPHCTVAMNSEDGEDVFDKSSELILREFKKTEGKYTALGLVKVTFPVEGIATIPFGIVPIRQLHCWKAFPNCIPYQAVL